MTECDYAARVQQTSEDASRYGPVTPLRMLLTSLLTVEFDLLPNGFGLISHHHKIWEYTVRIHRSKLFPEFREYELLSPPIYVGLEIDEFDQYARWRDEIPRLVRSCAPDEVRQTEGDRI